MERRPDIGSCPQHYCGDRIACAWCGLGFAAHFDNRISHDPWNLSRIIAEYSGRVELIGHVRCQATVFCDIADQLNEQAGSVLVPSLLLSNNKVMVDQPISLAGLIDGLAENEIPGHTRQLLDLRAADPALT